MAADSQKFIARNRAPRVQIEYDVELYGAEKKVQLPFVMGVLSDLAGKSNAAQPEIADRKFLEIDVDNFDDRMKAMQPRAAFSVPNTLTGEGNLTVDLTFESMDDFSPAALASKVAPLRALLDARTELANLTAYMDGKSGAEALIETLLANPGVLGALATETPSETDQTAALESLRAALPPEPAGVDKTQDVLSALRDQTQDDPSPSDNTGDVLASLRTQTPATAAPDTSTDDALASLGNQAVPETAPTDASADVLAGLRAQEPDPIVPNEDVDGVLANLAAHDAPKAPVKDQAADVLAGLAENAPEDREPDPENAQVLDSLRSAAPADVAHDNSEDAALETLRAASPEPEIRDSQASALDGLREVAVEETAEDTSAADALDALANTAPQQIDAPDDTADVLRDLAQSQPDAPTPEADDLEAVLGELADGAPTTAPDADTTAAALESLPVLDDAPVDGDVDLEALLADVSVPDTVDAAIDKDLDDVLAEDEPDGLLSETETEEEDVDLDDLLADDDLDGLLSDIETPEDPDLADVDLDDLIAEPETSETSDPEGSDLTDDDLDGLLSDIETPEAAETSETDLDDLLADVDLDGLLSDIETSEDPDLADVDLDDLIVEPETSEASDPDVSDSTDDDLDGLLSDIETPEAAETSETDLDDLLADVDLDGLLSQDADPDTADADFDNSELDVTLNTDGLGEDAQGDSDQPSEVTQGAQGNEHDQDPSEAGETVMRTGSAGLSFGAMSADRPAPQQLVRKRFRLAIFGDFSARSARGVLETGDDLAARAPIPLDPDTVEDVIESFATTLILPIGKDGAGIEIKLGGLDDLHPDELYENVELFSELAGLKTQLASGATADHAAKQLRAWGEAHGTPAAPARLKSSATSVPANLRLSDFQKLIGDASGRLSQASPMDEMLARVVGPHIRAVPDADTQAMQAAVDQALSAAMRLVLHHPEFQAVESQWRSLDLIARSIETDNTLDVVLYDVSAEEIAADLAQSEDLAQSGLARLLSDGPLDPETGRGGYSALIGLYGFEETPPHAEVLARIARVAAHVDAPFFGAMSPAFLETAKDDRHPLVAKAWDTLREMPEARHLGLATPRFMLRRPYGAKSEPIYEFEFEEFTMEAGLSGMLWANPVVLVAILLARSFRENGAHMDLGSIMSLGDIPFHYVKDRYGDQVALPCTERNLTLDKIETVMARGFMPLASIKGRDEIRLTSFQALGGGEILGPWSKETAPPPSAAKPTPAPAPQAETEDAPDEDLDALLAGLDDEPDAGDDDDFDLDALLSEFDDEVSDDDDMDTADDTGLDDIDAELAALLEDL